MWIDVVIPPCRSELLGISHLMSVVEIASCTSLPQHSLCLQWEAILVVTSSTKNVSVYHSSVAWMWRRFKKLSLCWFGWTCVASTSHHHPIAHAHKMHSVRCHGWQEVWMSAVHTVWVACSQVHIAQWDVMLCRDTGGWCWLSWTGLRWRHQNEVLGMTGAWQDHSGDRHDTLCRDVLLLMWKNVV